MKPHLGPLEASILAILRVGPATARSVREALRGQGSSLGYTTVATVLTRLHARGFVARRREPYRGSTRYIYASLGREDELLASMARDVEALAERVHEGMRAEVMTHERAGGVQTFRLYA